MKSISFITLGCRANQAENSEYNQAMLDAGWEVIDPEQNSAEVFLINTCTVTNESERQSRQMIRKISRNNPQAKLIVTGCSGKYLENNTSIKPLVDLFVPNLEKEKLIPRLYSHLGIEKDFEPLEVIAPVEDSETTRLNIKVSDGCNWACSFCIIPRVRGKLRSLTEEEIIAKVKKAETLGYKEVVLTAIQLGGYGKDFGKNGLEILIPRLLKETKIPRIRLSSIEPTDVSDRLIEELAKSERICNFFHIPVQSCSDKILDSMKRRYSFSEYLNRIEKIREYIPSVTITTDIMTGFPGENDEDFEESCRNLKKVGFNKLHIFPYSDRSGTAASKMSEKVSPEDIKIRKKILADIDHQIQLEWLNKAVGSKKEVLVENTKKGSYLLSGTTKDHFKVIFSSENFFRNDLLQIKITGVDQEKLCLIGEPV